MMIFASVCLEKKSDVAFVGVDDVFSLRIVALKAKQHDYVRSSVVMLSRVVMLSSVGQ